MKRIAMAAGILMAGTALAQAPEIPAHKCEPKPKLPSQRMRNDAMVMRTFNNDVKNYRDCITKFIDDRKAAMKANETAANAAIDEYNNTMKQLQDSDEPGSSGDSKVPPAGTQRPSTPPKGGY